MPSAYYARSAAFYPRRVSAVTVRMLGATFGTEPWPRWRGSGVCLISACILHTGSIRAGLKAGASLTAYSDTRLAIERSTIFPMSRTAISRSGNDERARGFPTAAYRLPTLGRSSLEQLMTVGRRLFWRRDWQRNALTVASRHSAKNCHDRRSEQQRSF